MRRPGEMRHVAFLRSSAAMRSRAGGTSITSRMVEDPSYFGSVRLPITSRGRTDRPHARVPRPVALAVAYRRDQRTCVLMALVTVAVAQRCEFSLWLWRSGNRRLSQTVPQCAEPGTAPGIRSGTYKGDADSARLRGDRRHHHSQLCPQRPAGPGGRALARATRCGNIFDNLEAARPEG